MFSTNCNQLVHFNTSYLSNCNFKNFKNRISVNLHFFFNISKKLKYFWLTDNILIFFSQSGSTQTWCFISRVFSISFPTSLNRRFYVSHKILQLQTYVEVFFYHNFYRQSLFLTRTPRSVDVNHWTMVQHPRLVFLLLLSINQQCGCVCVCLAIILFRCLVQVWYDSSTVRAISLAVCAGYYCPASNQITAIYLSVSDGMIAKYSSTMMERRLTNSWECPPGLMNYKCYR